MLGALGGGSDLACGGKKDSKSGDLFCTGLWPYDWGHVTGQASPGPQPFTGSLELNAGVVVLSFRACVCVRAGESWKGCLSFLLISCWASLCSWLTETGACVEGGDTRGSQKEIEGEGDNSRPKQSPPKDGHVLMPGTCALSLSKACRTFQWW